MYNQYNSHKYSMSNSAHFTLHYYLLMSLKFYIKFYIKWHFFISVFKKLDNIDLQ